MGNNTDSKDVCSHEHVKFIDNPIRNLIHNPLKIYKPYIKPGMKVMDIGCGGGFVSIGLAKLVGEKGSVLSVNLQQEMLDMVNKRATKIGFDNLITTHKCQDNKLGIDGMFDFANAFYMVHEVPDQVAMLQEVYDHLNPGGLFFIAEPSFHVNKKQFAEMIEVAEQIGFKVKNRPRIFFSLAVVLEK